MEFAWRPKSKAVNFCKYQFEFKTVSSNISKDSRKCAVGLDNIPASFLKDTKYVISKPLAHIINCSLKSGIVPSDFKQAKVSPIFKSVERSNFDNYRPISILPAVSKAWKSVLTVSSWWSWNSQIAISFSIWFQKTSLNWTGNSFLHWWDSESNG